MKTLAIMLLAIGAGLALWAIGSRISVDAAAMGIGLIFGVLAGVPVAGLLLATNGRNQYDQGYVVGYRAAQREEMERAGQQLVMRQSAALQATPRQSAISVEPRYTMAHPFALGGATVDGEVVP